MVSKRRSYTNECVLLQEEVSKLRPTIYKMWSDFIAIPSPTSNQARYFKP